jgi:predicted TIM-barrel fold metal-dependent hydrolase
MIVDMHVHPMLNRSDPVTCETKTAELLDCMDRVKIDKANVIPLLTGPAGLSSYYNEESTVFLAEGILKMLNGNEGRFYSMLYLNPYLNLNFLTDTIKKYILNGPVNGVKLLNEMRASDPLLEPLAAFLEKFGVPVLHHSWYNNFQGYSESTPRDIANLAKKFPNLRILMAHMRGARFRGIQDIKEHKNVWVDTSGSECEDGYLAYALKELGPERVVHGSDYPGRDFACAMGRVESWEMAPFEREMVFALNGIFFLEGETKTH